MNTTALIIEILIVGFQTTIWLVLIFLSIFGYSWIQLNTIEKLMGLSIIIIPISYSFGILFDRLWDFLLKSYDNKICSKYFNKSELHTKLICIFLKSESMTRFLDYIRNRTRIARASIFNFGLITLTLLLFIQIQLNHLGILKSKLLVFISIFGILITFLSFYSWKKMLNTYYKQIDIIYHEMNC